MRANVVKAGVPEALANKALTIYRERLQKLALSPPQVLLIEGGNENDRRTFARYWACCLLCSAKNGNAPCLSCQECQRILDDIHLDILAYDGAITKTQDEENPSFFRALITDNARALKGQVHNEPNGPYRIVYLTGIAQSRVEAPNALLKVLEDPIPSTRFVIMVPQREQILQTLVSRSLCFTLPWTYEEDLDDAEIRKLTTGLALFFSDKENFLATITTKNALPTPLAQQFIVACQKSLARVLKKTPSAPLDLELAKLPQEVLLALITWLQEAAEMVRSTTSPVSPSRVIEALAMRLYLERIKCNCQTQRPVDTNSSPCR